MYLCTPNSDLSNYTDLRVYSFVNMISFDRWWNNAREIEWSSQGYQSQRYRLWGHIQYPVRLITATFLLMENGKLDCYSQSFNQSVSFTCFFSHYKTLHTLGGKAELQEWFLAGKYIARSSIYLWNLNCVLPLLALILYWNSYRCKIKIKSLHHIISKISGNTTLLGNNMNC